MSQQFHNQQPTRTPSPMFAQHITAEPEENCGSSVSSLPFPSSSSEGNSSPHHIHYPHPHPLPLPHRHNSTLHSSSGTEVDYAERGEKALLLHAQEYKLPLTVKAIVDSYIQIANTMALITALLAAVQISMAQVVFTNNTTDGTPLPPAWLTLHWLVYAGIYLNSGATASALAFINYAGYLTSSARVLLLTDPNSWPTRCFYGEKLPFESLALPYIDQDFELMINFGLKKNMRPVWHSLSYGFYAGSFFFFVSLGLWIWLVEPLAVAISLTVLILPPAAWLTSSFFFTAEHVPSVPRDLAKNLTFCACTVLQQNWDPQPIAVFGKQVYAQ